MSRERILEEKNYVSERISETSRYVGFGLVAVYYAVQIDGHLSVSERGLFLVGLMGALTILFDYLQYLCAYWSTQSALWKKLEGWDQNSPLMWGRYLAFWLKQGSALIGALSLVYTMQATNG